MLRPVESVLNHFIPATPTAKFGRADTSSELINAYRFIRNVTLSWTIFVYILYIVCTVYPEWPLFTDSTHYWNAQLFAVPLLVTQLINDNSTHAIKRTLRVACILNFWLLIKPFVLLCTEIYTCNQLDDAEKEAVALCAAASRNNFMDPNSILACRSLVNIPVSRMGYASCAYLIDYVANAIQAFEFLLLFLAAYKDVLIFYAVSRVTPN